MNSPRKSLPLKVYGVPIVELHRHLDISTRMSTLFEWAKKIHHSKAQRDLDHFNENVWIRTPAEDLSKALDRFEIYAEVVLAPAYLEQLTYETLVDAAQEGIQKIELRYSPSFVTLKNPLPWKECLDAIQRGRRRAEQERSEIKSGLICIASRDQGMDQVEKTIEFFLQNLNEFVGFDLAGNEVGYPCRDFSKAFQPLQKAGVQITIHAGESTGPDEIWSAIEDLGAKRIGHGLSAIQDSQLLEILRRREICLEMCPTSNWLTSSVTDLKKHPFPNVLRAGNPVCLNTDDPSIFSTTLTREVQIARDHFGLTEAEIQTSFSHAQKYSFIK